jgi:hypothetical protein
MYWLKTIGFMSLVTFGTIALSNRISMLRSGLAQDVIP